MSDCPKCPSPGAPMWLATFADLMSLLMCFFVLLLSMASMDVVKFKAVADSMKEAFGVQREIQVDQIPMGNSVIEQHFSPGQPTITPIEDVKQSSHRQTDKLDVSPDDVSPEEMELAKQKVAAEKLEEIQAEAEKIKQALQAEIDSGQVTVDTNSYSITIRINEKGSFDSASAKLKPGFEPVMEKIAEAVAETKGKIIIAGHTDDIPIKTALYRSNWELSSSRAVTVAHFLLDKNQIDPMRLLIQGYAATHPLMPNTSAQNRGINRRVEVVISEKNMEPDANQGEDTMVIR